MAKAAKKSQNRKTKKTSAKKPSRKKADLAQSRIELIRDWARNLMLAENLRELAVQSWEQITQIGWPD